MFRFSIGDIVRHKLALGKPVPLMVVGRLLEECHGGAQFHYYLRCASAADELLRMSDFELDAWDDPSVAPIELLNRAKEEYVADQKWKHADAVRELIRRIKDGITETNERDK